MRHLIKTKEVFEVDGQLFENKRAAAVAALLQTLDIHPTCHQWVVVALEDGEVVRQAQVLLGIIGDPANNA